MAIAKIEHLSEQNNLRRFRNGGIVQLFTNVSMRYAHNGLADIAKEVGIDVETLQPGQYVVFLNTAQDRVKVYSSRGVLAYYRSETGRIQPQAIANIPEAFLGPSHLEWDVGLRRALEQILSRRRFRTAHGELVRRAVDRHNQRQGEKSE